MIDLDERVSVIEGDSADAVDRIDTLETAAAGRDDSLLDSFGDDAESTLEELCAAITSNWIYASNSAIETLLDDLHTACG